MQLTKRRKNSIFTFVIRLGGVAQLVERLNGIQEVRGSTPLISTTAEKNEPDHCRVLFCFISGTGCDCRKGKGMLNKTQDVCASAHTFFYDFAVHRKQMPTIIHRSVDEIQHIDKARRSLVVYNYKIIQMVDNLCTMCVLYSRCKFIY